MTLPSTMCGAYLNRHGGPDALEWRADLPVPRPGGHYAVAGAIAGPMVQADLRRIYLRDITLHGCTYQAPRVFARLMEMARADNIRSRISATYPLRDIALAQADFQAKSHAGKLVLLREKPDA